MPRHPGARRLRRARRVDALWCNQRRVEAHGPGDSRPVSTQSANTTPGARFTAMDPTPVRRFGEDLWVMTLPSSFGPEAVDDLLRSLERVLTAEARELILDVRASDVDSHDGEVALRAVHALLLEWDIDVTVVARGRQRPAVERAQVAAWSVTGTVEEALATFLLAAP
jgi:hypothetical protein